jgi:hypothetical protein
MKKQLALAVCAGAWICMSASGAIAAGDLATKAQKLPILEIGTGEAGYGMSQKTYELETGKAYRLKMKASGTHSCLFQGPEFFGSIYVRQIAAGEVEILNPTLSGFDFDDPSEAELYFVPVRIGKFTLGCKGLEEKGMTVEMDIK